VRSGADLAPGERVMLKFADGAREAVIDGETPPTGTKARAPRAAPRAAPPPSTSQGDLF